jgi:hypothetical protein
MNRRAFLAGSSAIALMPTPAIAFLKRSASSFFNNGKSQVNFNFPSFGNEFPFLNIVKTAQAWNYSSNPNANAQVSPQFNDANGYPTQCQSQGYYSLAYLPATIVRGGTYSMTWVGGDSTTVMSGFGTVVSGSLTGANDGTRWVTLQPNATTSPQQVRFGVNTISASPLNYVSSISIVYTADLPAYNAGEIFGTQFKAILKQGGWGVYRFLNWMPANQSNVTTWATRKPLNYFTYADVEYRASLFAGTTSEGSFNGYDYAVSFGSGAPVDKQTIQLYFDQTSTFKSASITYTTGAGGGVNWTAHGFSGGEPIGLTPGFLQFPPPNISSGQTYYVLAAGLTANFFQIAATPGGSPITVATGASGGQVGTRLCTLNLNGGGAVPIKDFSGNPTTDLTNQGTGPQANATIATLVYDADLSSWLKNGGDGTGSGGLSNGCPFEIMIQLCKEMGAHPWFPAPMMAVDPMTDWHSQAAAYIKSNGPSWMIPRFEGCNELWNSAFGFWQTEYAWNKAFLHWGSQFDSNNWVGKTLSTIGQAVNASYGGAVGAGYQIVVGVQTGPFQVSVDTSQSPRLTSTEYLAQSASPQSGYTKSAASNWATHVCCSVYYGVTSDGTGQQAAFAANSSQITGSISAGTLTISASAFGTVVAGQTLTDLYGLIPAGVTVTGGSGSTWTISNSSISIPSGTTMRLINSAGMAALNAFVDTVNTNSNVVCYQNVFTFRNGYTNNAGNALKMNAYEGGFAINNGSTNITYLNYFSKFTTDAALAINGGTLVSGTVLTGMYNDFTTTAGGEFPSLFQLGGGPDNQWAIMDPDIYITPQPQLTAIGTYN